MCQPFAVYHACIPAKINLRGCHIAHLVDPAAYIHHTTILIDHSRKQTLYRKIEAAHTRRSDRNKFCITKVVLTAIQCLSAWAECISVKHSFKTVILTSGLSTPYQKTKRQVKTGNG